MDKYLQIRELSEQLQSQVRASQDMREQLESIDNNRRLSSLILTCQVFEKRFRDEDMEIRVVHALNARFPELALNVADIQVAHRLQSDAKVYVKFLKRRTRDRVFDCRFQRQGGAAASGNPSGRRDAAGIRLR